MRAFTACVLVAMLSFSSAYAAGPRMFADWLEQTTAAVPTATIKSASGPRYEEAETETFCLKDTAVKNCRCIGCADSCALVDDDDSSLTPPVPVGCTANTTTCCSTAYQEFAVACCSEQDYDNYGYYRDDSLPSALNLDIGSCEFTYFLFPFDQAVTIRQDTLDKAGTFNAICNIDGGHCHHPLCDSMVLTWTGSIYYSYDAVSMSNPAPPNLDGSCGGTGDDDSGRAGGRMAHMRHGKRKAKSISNTQKTSSVPAKKAGAAEVAYNNDSPSTYFSGQALILSGPVTISSRKYNLQYTTGYMDKASWFITEINGQPVQITAAEAATKFLVNPDAYNLKVFKTRGDDHGHEREYEHDEPRHYERRQERDFNRGYEGEHYNRNPERRN